MQDRRRSQGLNSPTAGGSAVLQPSQLDRLLRGQHKIEVALEEVHRAISRLPDVLKKDLNFPSYGLAGLEQQQAENIAHNGKSSTSSIRHAGSVQSASTAVGMSFGTFADDTPTFNGTIREEVPIFILPAATLHEVSTGAENSTKSSSDGMRVHDVFEVLALSMVRSDYAEVKEMISSNLTLHLQSSETGPFVNKFSGAMCDLIIPPTSSFCTVLDSLRAVMLLVDAIMVPYVIAWSLELTGWLYYFACFVVLFWTCDLILNFFTGYIAGGEIVMKHRKIAKQYLKRGFAVDLLVLLAEFTEVLSKTLSPDTMPDTLSLVKVLRFFKITRLIRIVAQLRAGLFIRIGTAVMTCIHNRGLVAIQGSLIYISTILKLVFVIIWFGHVGATLWHAVQRNAATAGEDRWESFVDPDAPLYVHGLYWSVSTMFSGASPMMPMNWLEAMVAVLWIIFGAVFVTSITSLFAAMLIASQEKRQAQNGQVQLLRSWLSQQKTPTLLSLAVQANFKEKAGRKEALTENDIPLADMIAVGLREALREHQYSDAVLELPFFRMMCVLANGILKEICFTMSSVLVVKAGEEVFHPAQEIEHAILLAEGSMSYNWFEGARHSRHHLRRSFTQMQMRESEQSKYNQSVSVLKEAWVCELALLICWQTTGRMEADMNSELLLVASDKFIKVVVSSPILSAAVASYAEQACNMLQCTEAAYSYTDVDCQLDCDVVVSQLHTSIRAQLLSFPTLEVLRRQQTSFMGLGTVRGDRLADLEDEITRGVSHLMVGPKGANNIYRVARIVVLQLSNKDGMTLVQLAKSAAGMLQPKFHLPGCKVLAGEQPSDAIQRLIEEQLSLLREGIELQEVKTQVEDAQSATYGIPTKYIKLVYTAVLRGKMVRDMNSPGFLSMGRGRSEKPLVMTISGAWSWTWNSSMALGSDTMVSSRFPCRPLDSEGATHSFAVLQNGTGKLPTEGNATNIADHVQANDIRIFQWLPEEDFAGLYKRREEAQAEINTAATHITVNQWHKLLQWRLQEELQEEVLELCDGEPMLVPHVGSNLSAVCQFTVDF